MHKLRQRLAARGRLHADRASRRHRDHRHPAGDRGPVVPRLQGSREPDRRLQADVRAAVPSAEAYYADNGNYTRHDRRRRCRLIDSGPRRRPRQRSSLGGRRRYCLDKTVGGKDWSRLAWLRPPSSSATVQEAGSLHRSARPRRRREARRLVRPPHAAPGHAAGTAVQLLNEARSDVRRRSTHTPTDSQKELVTESPSFDRRTARRHGRARRVRPPPDGRLAAGDPRQRPARAAAGSREADARGDADAHLPDPLDRAAEAPRDAPADRLLALDSRASRASASTPTSSARAVGAAFRLIPAEIKTLEELGMPDAALRARREAARPRARHRPDRLRQVDDARLAARPHQPARGTSTSSRSRTRSSSCTGTARASSTSARSARTRRRSPTALRAALRQDPDVILVGEMRDLETIATALTAAETGHLVFATLHTQSAPQTIDRVIDVFPAEQQDQVRVQLAVDAAGRRHAEPRADRRRPRPRRRARDPDARRRRPQPDPPGEDRADLLGHADEHLARHADDGAVARRPGAAPASSRPRSRSRARRGPISCAACSSAPA